MSAKCLVRMANQPNSLVLDTNLIDTQYMDCFHNALQEVWVDKALPQF